MFESILRIFDFLSPNRTEARHQPPKPMAIPVDERLNTVQQCEHLFKKLDAVEAEVLSRIDNPEQAWPFLCRIRQLRRETQNDLLSLLPEGSWVFSADSPALDSPVRAANTRTGATLQVFNGGRADY
jgi:hypothetical protein